MNPPSMLTKHFINQGLSPIRLFQNFQQIIEMYIMSQGLLSLPGERHLIAYCTIFRGPWENPIFDWITILGQVNNLKPIVQSFDCDRSCRLSTFYKIYFVVKFICVLKCFVPHIFYSFLRII